MLLPTPLVIFNSFEILRTTSSMEDFGFSILLSASIKGSFCKYSPSKYSLKREILCRRIELICSCDHTLHLIGPPFCCSQKHFSNCILAIFLLVNSEDGLKDIAIFSFFFCSLIIVTKKSVVIITFSFLNFG